MTGAVRTITVGRWLDTGMAGGPDLHRENASPPRKRPTTATTATTPMTDGRLSRPLALLPAAGPERADMAVPPGGGGLPGGCLGCAGRLAAVLRMALITRTRSPAAARIGTRAGASGRRSSCCAVLQVAQLSQILQVPRWRTIRSRRIRVKFSPSHTAWSRIRASSGQYCRPCAART